MSVEKEYKATAWEDGPKKGVRKNTARRVIDNEWFDEDSVRIQSGTDERDGTVEDLHEFLAENYTGLHAYVRENEPETLVFGYKSMFWVYVDVDSTMVRFDLPE